MAPPAFRPAATRSGINPLKLGHVAFIVDDPEATSAFYARVLGFRVSDWVDRFFVFMRCGPDHHTVNFLKAAGRRMHHFAFEMRDAAHLIESCDTLAGTSSRSCGGRVRHGPGHNIATYHLNTDHLMIELFTELDRMSDEAAAISTRGPGTMTGRRRPRHGVAERVATYGDLPSRPIFFFKATSRRVCRACRCLIAEQRRGRLRPCGQQGFKRTTACAPRSIFRRMN